MKKLICLGFALLTVTHSIFSQNVNTDISVINDNHLPYKESKIVFNITCPKLDALYIDFPELSDTLCKKEEVLKVTLEKNSIDLSVNKSVQSFSDYKIVKRIEDAEGQIKLLLKYLSGFYFGSLLESNLIQESTDDSLRYVINYEYKGIKCKNVYNISNGLLNEIQVYQTQSETADVSTKYFYTTYNGKNYLDHFDLKNTYHNFNFSLYIKYQESKALLLPSEIKTTVSQNNMSIDMTYMVLTK